LKVNIILPISDNKSNLGSIFHRFRNMICFPLNFLAPFIRQPIW